MQTFLFRATLVRASWALSLVLLAGCGASDHPYAALHDPPLVTAQLHAVTLVADSPAAADHILASGYVETPLAPNYQQANAVEGSIWGVPAAVAGQVRHFKPARAGPPDLQLLIMPLAARGRTAEPATDRLFFRNVLGADVPQWPLQGADGKPDDHLRVQAWVYRVASILEANRRLRENGIPVIFDPVSITTAYLGDYKTLAIRAPDGTVVQLVETAAL
jgi:hypothetical protein